MNTPHLILGVGELLWDFLPERPATESQATAPARLLGGAPANFTVMSGRLGNHAAILSRIGRDDLGREAVNQLDPMPVDKSALQIDPLHDTGRVTVDLVDGEPHYTIHQPSAWDFLELNDEWMRLAERADAICFGSLAQRNQVSCQTIQTLAAQTSSSCVRVFDVNLRAPFFSSEVIEESLELATVLKMNETEVPQILTMLDLPVAAAIQSDNLLSGARHLFAEFPNLNLVAITRGGHGSLLVGKDDFHDHPGIPVTVVDPIGAGDAFTAAITHYILRGADLETLNEAGNRWGAWVASQPGAMPALPDDLRIQMAAAIEH